MSRTRQLHLGAFLRPVSIHTGAWRYPGALPDGNFNFAHYRRFVEKLQRGKFDAIFLADSLARIEMPKGALARSANDRCEFAPSRAVGHASVDTQARARRRRAACSHAAADRTAADRPRAMAAGAATAVRQRPSRCDG